MKRARPVFVALLAWLFCLQAYASVASVQCRHAPARPAVQAPPASAMPEAAGGHHHQHMLQGQDGEHAVAAPPHADAATALCACGDGCVCAGPCAGTCLGVTAGLVAALPYSRSVPAVPVSVVTLTAAHGPDLYRPPSIS